MIFNRNYYNIYLSMEMEEFKNNTIIQDLRVNLKQFLASCAVIVKFSSSCVAGPLDLVMSVWLH